MSQEKQTAWEREKHNLQDHPLSTMDCPTLTYGLPRVSIQHTGLECSWPPSVCVYLFATHISYSRTHASSHCGKVEVRPGEQEEKTHTKYARM